MVIESNQQATYIFCLTADRTLQSSDREGGLKIWRWHFQIIHWISIISIFIPIKGGIPPLAYRFVCFSQQGVSRAYTRDYTDLYVKGPPIFAFLPPWLSSWLQNVCSFRPVGVTVYTFCNITIVNFSQECKLVRGKKKKKKKAETV